MLYKVMKVTKLIEIDAPCLGERIKKVRMSDVRTLREICAIVGMSTQNWYRMEAEKQSISIETLRKIESVLGIDLEVNLDYSL